MPNPFPCVGLIGKQDASEVLPTLARVLALLRASGREVRIDSASASGLPHAAHEALTRERIAAGVDLVIAVGGDGTLLHAARSVVEYGTPILGINEGRLGFLADLSPTELDGCLGELLDGHYREDARALLGAEVLRDGGVVAASHALNDVVLHKTDIARMIEYEVRADHHRLGPQRADGLIVATPTGSTAYALSSGGPIVHPDLAAVLLVPICPQGLSHRPLVLDDRCEIELTLLEGRHSGAQLTCDGQISIELRPGDRIRVRRHPRSLRLLHPFGYDYYQILRTKMRWGN